MLKDSNTSYSYNIITLLFVYSLVIGVSIISFPVTSLTYWLVRFIQAVEMLIFALLFVPRIQQVLQIKKFNLYVNLWWLFYVVNTFIHANDVGITPVFTWLNVALLLLLGTKYWSDNMRSALKALTIIFSFLIYLNGVLLILFPNGLWIDPAWVGRGSDVRFLFGNQNQTGLVCLFAISLQCLYTFAYKAGRFNLFLLIVVSLASIIFLGSMTSVIGVSLITLYIILNRFFKNPKLLLIIFFIIYIAIFLLIIWFGNDIDQVKWVASFIEGTLNKDTTFSKRTTIWENAVNLIQRSPIVGYGIQNVDWNDEHLQGSGAHNLWVMLLLNGGIISCFSFIFLTLYAIRNALLQKSKITTTAVIALCILFVMSFFEAYNIIYMFFFLQLVYYSPCIQPTENILEEKGNTNLLQ